MAVNNTLKNTAYCRQKNRIEKCPHNIHAIQHFPVRFKREPIGPEVHIASHYMLAFADRKRKNIEKRQQKEQRKNDQNSMHNGVKYLIIPA